MLILPSPANSSRIGLLPNQFLLLTVNELNALYEGHKKREERADERAAIAGYCAASGVTTWFNEGLKGFDKFYSKPEADEPLPKAKSNSCKMNAKKAGSMADSLTDEQIASASTA
jgi:hypothetical protein